jgi:uncharacterized protein (TIGR02246 family)
MAERPNAYGQAADERDVEQITQLIANLEAGMNHNDVELIDRQFTDDVLWLTASGKRLMGWDAMNAYHQMGLADAPSDLRIEWRILSLHFVSPDVAVAHTKQEYLAPETGTNHGTAVLIKKDGAWWICAMQHTNAVS